MKTIAHDPEMPFAVFLNVGNSAPVARFSNYSTAKAFARDYPGGVVIDTGKQLPRDWGVWALNANRAKEWKLSDLMVHAQGRWFRISNTDAAAQELSETDVRWFLLYATRLTPESE